MFNILEKLKSEKFKREIKAELRYLKIILWEFKWSLFFFFTILTVSSILLHIGTEEENRSILKSINSAMHLIFMDQPIEFPQRIYLQILFLLLPIIGLGIIAEGLIRFIVLLFNKKSKMEVWQMALASTYSNHTVVCGLGKVGYRVVKRLIYSKNDIIVVEKNPKNSFFKEMEDHNIPVILGESNNKDILKQARIQTAKALVLVTDNDLVNLESGLIAKELNQDLRIIMRMFDPNLAKFIKEEMKFRTFSTSEIAAPTFASAVFSDNIINAIDIDGTEANMARYIVPENSKLIGIKLSDIEREYDITFLLHQNSSKRDVHPSPDIIIASKDLIIFLAPTESLLKIEKYLK